MIADQAQPTSLIPLRKVVGEVVKKSRHDEAESKQAIAQCVYHNADSCREKCRAEAGGNRTGK